MPPSISTGTEYVGEKYVMANNGVISPLARKNDLTHLCAPRFSKAGTAKSVARFRKM